MNNNKQCSRCGEIKPYDEFYNDKRRSDGLYSHCKLCHNKCTKNWFNKNPEYYKDKWISDIQDEQKLFNIRERNKRDSSNYASNNQEKRNSSRKKYESNNKPKANARSARRRAAQLRATPKWANNFIISEIYELSKIRTETLGLEFHVDHIVPLKSKVVCGLHTEANLQILPGKENISKGNRRWLQMP